MLYKQDIANLALGHLGMSQQVLDLETENTIYAKVIRRHFRMSLDTMLEAHEWGFATQFAALPLVNDAYPILAYKYAYSLPADCQVLRMIAPDGNFPQLKLYEQEKAKFRNAYAGAGEKIIYTNVANAHGEYTTRVSEEFAFPTHFGRGLSHLLALDIAPQLITNNFPKVKNDLITTSRNELSLAIAADLGREPLMEDSPSPFISCRMGL